MEKGLDTSKQYKYTGHDKETFGSLNVNTFYPIGLDLYLIETPFKAFANRAFFNQSV